MKKPRDTTIVQITQSEIEEYALRMTTQESSVVKNLVASSNRELEFIDMQSGNLVGQLLKLLIQVSGAKRILEIGTFTGYSALMLAEALPEDGKVITMEMNIRYQKLAEMHFRTYDPGQKIELLKGNARELLDELDEMFDMVFLDADKVSYAFYYEKLIPKLKSGGLLIADNVLWGGSVLNPEDEKSKTLHEFNKLAKDDERVEQVLLPVRDGITIIRKK